MPGEGKSLAVLVELENHMPLRLDGPLRCIFGTCDQVATHRVNRQSAFLPLCAEHGRMMAAEGVPLEPIPPRRQVIAPSDGQLLRRSA
jgi:hypothetical protein